MLSKKYLFEAKDVNREILIEKLNEDGIIIFNNIYDEKEMLRISHYLGQPIVQDDTAENGVLTKSRKEHESYTTLLHTDRASMSTPPNVVFLYFKRQSGKGGESIFADGLKIYEEIKEKHPEIMDSLFKKDSVMFGLGEYVFNTEIFSQSSSAQTYIRWRYDKGGYFSPSLIPHIEIFLNILEKHTHEIKFKSGQGFIVQNGRWLHGNHAFEGSRTMKRVVMDSKEIPLGF